MRYESQKTLHGNVGVSYVSQEAADAQAAEMEANNCSNCFDCPNCFDCSCCSCCSDCSGCSRCSGCSCCSGILVWRGPKAEKLIAINGLIWPVSTDGVNVQIGCQQHTVEAWQEFDDARIGMMDSRALEFWKQFKATVFAMVEYRRSL